ncbi:MAG: pyrroline-5-carboxylate reductase [Betaproteobacteria bacterium]
MRILFIGGGNMCQAIIGGLVAQGASAADMCAIEPLADTRAVLSRMNIESFEHLEERHLDVDVILLAVKPQMMRTAIAPMAGKLAKQLVLSIAAGIRSEDIASWLQDYRNIVRAMPNTPALIRAGITGLHALAGVGGESKVLAEKLLGAVGKTSWFKDEGMLDAVTAVSGSGPAYVFYFMEALERAALELGFDEIAAREFALQTFLGGARLAADSSESPETLRRRVTSKRGTTEAAIASFDSLDLKKQIIQGVKAACERSRELGVELGQGTGKA